MKHSRLPKKNVTRAWLKYVIADEKKSSKDYVKHGFPELAKDERHHAKVLTGFYNRMVNK
jgi:hypothetical protein